MRRFTATLFLTASIGCSLPLSAQLQVSRQVLATTVQSSTPDNDNFLKFTAHAGEFLIGTYRGDLRATAGFQQPDDDITVATISVAGQNIVVKAYPNPTAETLTVELAEAAPTVTEIRIYDPYGRQLLEQPTNRTARVHFPNVGRLPSGMYFLRARMTNGELLYLTQIIVTPH